MKLWKQEQSGWHLRKVEINDCHSRTLCPGKIAFKNEDDIKTFSDQNIFRPTDRWKKNPRWKHSDAGNNKQQRKG